MGVNQVIDELYFDGYYGKGLEEKSILNRLFQGERTCIALSTIDKGKILDVGCGNGAFLRSLSAERWQRFGYEPSAAGQSVLASSNIQVVDLAEPDDSLKGQLDVVTLWQSFEHIATPSATLESIRGLLSPNGYVFISVPNFGSWQAKFFGSFWFHLDPVRHVIHYELETVKALLEKHHWKINEVGTLSLEYGVAGWWQSFFNLFPFDFNMAYKKLKRHKFYDMSIVNIMAWTTYIALSPFIIPLAGMMTLLEAAFGHGAVLNLKISPSSNRIHS